MTAMCGPRRSRSQPITEHVQKVAMTAKELKKMLFNECGHVSCCLQFYLPDFFPALKEFILVLRPGPMGATAEDLYEVHSGDGHHYHQELIDEVTEAFDEMQKMGSLQNVKLSFMRLEQWEDTGRDERTNPLAQQI
jgi:hypothetical protein